MASVHPLELVGAAARTLIVAASLVAAGCTLVQPGCRNRDVKSAIEKEARESVEFTLATSQQNALSPDTPFALIEPVEMSRHDDTRSCSAKVMVGDGSKAVTVPIEYEVTGGESGEAFYSWNRDDFGRKFIGTTLFSMLSGIVGQPASDGAANNRRRRESSQPSDVAIPFRPEPTEREKAEHHQLLLERWHDSVTAAINAQAINFRIDGSGSVSLAFTVSASGDLSDVKIVQGSGNAALDQTAVQMVEKVGHVRPPPSRQATSFAMKLSFL